jgi:hypothetical protein
VQAKVPYLLLAIVTVTAVTMLLSWRRDRRSLEELSKRRDNVCLRLEWDLQSIVANRTKAARHDLEVRIRHHVDEGLMQLCFGKPIVVETADANRCSIMSDGRGDECYVDVARALFVAYRARRHAAAN